MNTNFDSLDRRTERTEDTYTLYEYTRYRRTDKQYVYCAGDAVAGGLVCPRNVSTGVFLDD